MKKIRRILITILTILLIPSILMSIPSPTIKHSEHATKISINKFMKIDKDLLLIHKIVIDDKNSYLKYTVFRSKLGWNFGDHALKIYDDKRNEIPHMGGRYYPKMWGGQGIIELEKISLNEVKYLLLKYEHYDRKSQKIIQLSVK